MVRFFCPYFRGYLDPLCLATGVMSIKCDVYAFGVMLLEIITSRCAATLYSTEQWHTLYLVDYVSNYFLNS